MNYKRFLASPGIYQYWFFGTPHFEHFLNQCVFSYPSPLDENGPVSLRFILFAVAGIVEYVFYCGFSEAADSLGIVFSLLFCKIGLPILTSKDCKQYSFAVYDWSFTVLLLISFSLRFPSFVRTIKRKCPQAGWGEAPNFGALATTLFWYNPAVMYYLFGKFLAWFLALDARISAVKIFWAVMAPMYDMPNMKEWLTLDKGVLLKTLKANLTKAASLTGLIQSTLKIMFLEKIVKSLPIMMILFTQSVQGDCAKQSATSNNKQQFGAGLPQLPKVLSQPIKVGLNILELLYSVTWRMLALVYISFVEIHRNIYQSASGKVWLSETQLMIPSVRLLTILPGLEEEEIQCTLGWHRVDFLSATPYSAVSYSWGKSDLVRQIKVNGKSEQITQSAYDILVALRSHVKPKTIWIDAICINQSSIPDKQQQIPLMADIYSRANEVIIWLGQSNSASLAVGLVERLFLHYQINRNRGQFSFGQVSVASAKAFRKMLQLSWFERSWIIQEVVCSRSTVTVRYGDESIDWSRLSWFLHYVLQDQRLQALINEDLKNALGLQDQKLQALLSEYLQVFALKRAALQNAQTIHRFKLLKSSTTGISLLFYLAQIYRSTTRFKVTVELDRVYALLGLLPASSVSNPSVLSSTEAQNLLPSYDITERDLYVKIARLHAANSDSINKLDFLMYAGRGWGHKTDNLPSWAPDWSLSPAAMPIVGMDGSYELLHSPLISQLVDDAARLASHGKVDAIPGEPSHFDVAKQNAERIKNAVVPLLFNASPGTVASFSFDGEVLEVLGKPIDYILCVGEELVGRNLISIKETVRTMCSWAKLVKMYLPATYRQIFPGQLLTREMAFFRALMNNVSNPEIDLTFTEAISRHPDENEAASALVTFNILSTLPEQALADDSALEMWQKLAQHIKKTCTGRVLGITRSGFIGLFLKGTKAGDVVSLVYGCKVPFSLSLSVSDGQTSGQDAVNSVFELIGPSYVEGLMDGQGIALPTQPYKIRLK